MFLFPPQNLKKDNNNAHRCFGFTEELRSPHHLLAPVSAYTPTLNYLVGRFLTPCFATSVMTPTDNNTLCNLSLSVSLGVSCTSLTLAASGCSWPFIVISVTAAPGIIYSRYYLLQVLSVTAVPSGRSLYHPWQLVQATGHLQLSASLGHPASLKSGDIIFISSGSHDNWKRYVYSETRPQSVGS